MLRKKSQVVSAVFFDARAGATQPRFRQTLGGRGGIVRPVLSSRQATAKCCVRCAKRHFLKTPTSTTRRGRQELTLVGSAALNFLRCTLACTYWVSSQMPLYHYPMTDIWMASECQVLTLISRILRVALKVRAVRNIDLHGVIRASIKLGCR